MQEHPSEIEQAKNDLAPQDRAALERANELFKEKAKGRDLDDWLEIAKGHNVRVRMARRLAKTNKRSGATYNKYLHRFMQHDGIDTSDRLMMGNLTAITWISDDEHPERLSALATLRSRMTPGELARLNSPHTARAKVKKCLDKEAGVQPNPRAVSPMAKMAEEKRDLLGKIDDLSERLARAEAGSLFNRDDRPKDVIAVIVGTNFSPDKLKQIEDGIRTHRLAHANDKAPLPNLKAKS